MTAATRTRSGGGRVVLIGAVLIAVLLVVGAVSADRRTGRPFDPASSDPEGVKALVELVTSFGATVTVPDRLPNVGDDIDVAVIFSDLSTDADRDALTRWVRAGHVLVVADPASALVPEADIGAGSLGSSGSSTIARGDCPVRALDGVDELDPGDQAWYRFVDTNKATFCFRSSDGAFLSAQAEGDGTIIGLASPSVFTNELLGQSDNAVLATTLMAPKPGTRVALLTEKAFPAGGSSDGVSLSTLISPGVKLLLLELVVALVVFAFARGRRLGRPISEPQPVQIAGSELVDAVGQLLRQRRDPTTAAAALRADLWRTIVTRLGVSPDASAPVVAEAVASRTTLEANYVLAVLADQPVAGDAELAALAVNIDRIREEVLHGHAP